MTVRDELDRRLAAWMVETGSGPPPAGRFERAMMATARRRPRPRWLAAFGSAWVGAAGHRVIVPAWPGLRRELVVAATVALLVAAFVGIQLLGGPGSTYTQGPTATPVTPAPRPSASVLPPGTYSLANPCTGACADYRRISFTLPAGWAISDGLVAKHLDQRDEVAFSAWTPDRVYADPCHWQASVLSPLDLSTYPHDGNGPTPAPEAAGLANQALRGPRPRPLTEVTLGGVSRCGSTCPYPPTWISPPVTRDNSEAGASGGSSMARTPTTPPVSSMPSTRSMSIAGR